MRIVPLKPKALGIIDPVTIKYEKLVCDYPKATRIQFTKNLIWNFPKSLIKIYYHNKVVVMPAKFAQQRGLEHLQV